MLLKLRAMGYRPINDMSDFVIWSPRDWNPVADHAVNATMDAGNKSWGRGNTHATTEALRQGLNLRLCVDGGRRSIRQGAMGFAMYHASGSSPNRCSYKILLRGGKALEDVASAFLAEAMALEWAVECLSTLVERIVLHSFSPRGYDSADQGTST